VDASGSLFLTCPGELPQPVAPAKALKERVAHMQRFSARPIQSRDDHFIADDPDGLLPGKVRRVSIDTGAEDGDEPIAGVF
jgi:hypothetical protein